MSKTCNGYTNYETWCVNLWLDNEPSTQQFVYELANSPEYERDIERADALKAYIDDWQEIFEGDNTASMFTDLLSHAISKVSFLEIIDNAKVESGRLGEADHGKP